MPDDRLDETSETTRFATRLTQVGRPGARAHGFVNTAVVRGSTVLHPDLAHRKSVESLRNEQAMVYGTHGTPTHFALENAIAEIEGGTRCQIVSSGLSAITTPLLAFLKTGEHVLVPDCVYGPTRRFCDGMLAGLGIKTTYYDPMITPEALEGLMRPETRVLFLESPGSHTFEVQDVPALSAVAHAHGARVLMDNTWGIHFFQPFRHGVDVSIQAATKYIGGHSDIILGAVTVADESDWHRLRDASMALGQYASPDDCWLALRGIRSLGVRLKHQMAAGLEVANWLAERPEVLRVLHPALPDSPGHALWKRDFTGASSLFGVVLKPNHGVDAVGAMIDGMTLFGIGASWGGFESLILPTSGTIQRTAGTGKFGGEMMRLHIGLEDVADIKADLERGFAKLNEVTGG
ncbi:cystathionine beta-lyase [Acidisoma cellulosilytica]|uniref:Cystathionine beta-lyase n=1 Tax=Acidisoma cellulosilyticum TaxID=2802395 RepID=A0A963Z2V9_9PROT|nr:cystathionine beta-lyase [Acidisoma cellulosilyticum]MCB8880808.1 cystathionine beta-lyase [Acidisoma cellulosilyticum]